MALESRITDLRGAHGNMFGNVTFNPGRTLSWEEFVLKPLAYDPARETSECATSVFVNDALRLTRF
jgi:hypothetical protein